MSFCHGSFSLDTKTPFTHTFRALADIEDAKGLTGKLNIELRELTSLRALVLQNGAITGVIPDIFNSVPFLEVLDLDFNFIGGEIPETVYDLPGLIELDLNHNRLRGQISTRIGQLRNLQFLQVHNNQMTGIIPREIGNLQFLGKPHTSSDISTMCVVMSQFISRTIELYVSVPEFATFHRNFFEGSVPNAICALPNLEEITSDCFDTTGRESPPFVACQCCTGCF